MMINCPKCNLLQPKARHCVQCGTDVKNWNPKKNLSWRQVVGHWFFQLTVLFSIIFLVVLRDSFKDQINKPEVTPRNTPEKRLRIQTKSRSFPMNSFNSKPDEFVMAAVESRKGSLSGSGETEQKVTTLRKKVIFKAATMSRRAIEDLMEKGQRLGENTLLVETRYFLRIANKPSSEFKIMGQISKNFQPNQGIPLFIGETNPDINLDLGFYLDLTVFEDSHPEGIHLGLQTWYQLKANTESLKTELEVIKSHLSSLILIKPQVHDISLTGDETQFFESSQSLKPLVDENFQNEFSDIILVLEIR